MLKIIPSIFSTGKREIKGFDFLTLKFLLLKNLFELINNTRKPLIKAVISKKIKRY